MINGNTETPRMKGSDGHRRSPVLLLRCAIPRRSREMKTLRDEARISGLKPSSYVLTRLC